MSETKEHPKKDASDPSKMTLDEIYLHIHNETVSRDLEEFMRKQDDINYQICFIYYTCVEKVDLITVREINILEKGCEQNIGMAFYTLGQYHLFNIPGAYDYKKAKELLEKGCALNVGMAFVDLGHCYRFKSYGSLDLNKTIKLYEKGCELDENFASSYLGEMYEMGEGVEKNIQKARQLYQRGMKLGSYRAFDKLLYLNIKHSDEFSDSGDFDALAEYANIHSIAKLHLRPHMRLLHIIHKKNLRIAELNQLMTIAMSKGQADFVITQSAQYLS
jgi:hypothetical protein